MTKEEIIEMARRAGMMSEVLQLGRNLELLTDFAKLVAEKEREACAKMCDYVYNNIVTDEHIKDMAFKIRARGQE
jgi:hypothetical protein